MGRSMYYSAAAFGCSLAALAVAGLTLVLAAVGAVFIFGEEAAPRPLVPRADDPCMATCVARHHDWFWDPSLTLQENTEALQSACRLLCWNP